jgi:NADH dehydrogenase
MTTNLLVTGGTGFVGRHAIAHWLRERPAARVTVLTRSRRHATALAPLPGVTVVEGDVHDPATLARVLPGHDALLHLVAVLHGTPQRFETVHVELPRRLAAACAAAGLTRIVHVSALGVSEDGPSDYQRSKARGEAVWREAGLTPTVLRPSVIFGADDRFLNLFAALQGVMPVMALAGAGATLQPVWVGDVAQAVVHALERRDLAGRVIECAGPQVWTLGDLVRFAGQASGHARPVLPLPEAAGRLQAALLGLLPGEPLMSADNLRSLRVPNVATGDHPGLTDLGITPLPVQAAAAWLAGPRATRLDRFRGLRR